MQTLHYKWNEWITGSLGTVSEPNEIFNDTSSSTYVVVYVEWHDYERTGKAVEGLGRSLLLIYNSGVCLEDI
jgi:hypothetical protein